MTAAVSRLVRCAGLLLFGLLAWPQAIEAAEADLAAAQKDFEALCAPCHGRDAKGHGPVSASLQLLPADLTGISARHGGTFPAETVFETISGLSMPDAHGTREMPVWGDLFVSEQVGSAVDLGRSAQGIQGAAERIEGLVHYLESIQESPE